MHLVDFASVAGININPSMNTILDTLFGVVAPLYVKVLIELVAVAALIRVTDLRSVARNAFLLVAVSVFILPNDFFWSYLELPLVLFLFWEAMPPVPMIQAASVDRDGPADDGGILLPQTGPLREGDGPAGATPPRSRRTPTTKTGTTFISASLFGWRCEIYHGHRADGPCRSSSSRPGCSGRRSSSPVAAYSFCGPP